MEHTFMTIHSTDPDAVILFVSDSVYDILGYTPQEVQGKSCFEFFHPEEVPFARSIHSRGVLLDKAAVLHYVRIQARDGQWVSWRAIEAPQIRRIFSSSPRDPRYHMLEHLSPKFRMPPVEREPRAALILNRFTRTLTVMFATNAVASILGVRPDQIKDKSFYECIQENCLPDAIRCLESAKANDSIAYLRFWYRDPRRPEDFEDEEDDDEHNSGNSSDSEGGGVQLDSRMDVDDEPPIKQEDTGRPDLSAHSSASQTATTMASGSSSRTQQTSATTAPSTAGPADQRSPPAEPLRNRRREPNPTFELEAVVSCTSDGLVVVLRKARPPIPAPHPPLLTPTYTNGLFAAPWGHHPIRPQAPQDMLYAFRPPLMPQYMPLRDNVMAIGGPPVDHLMSSIRDVAVFAWALVGINGNLATYTRGLPRGEAQPDGLPVWDPTAGNISYSGPENQAVRRWADYDEKHRNGFGPSSSEYEQSRSHESSSGYSHAPQIGRSNYTYSQPPPVWPGLQPAYTSAYDQYGRDNPNQTQNNSLHHQHRHNQNEHQHQHQQQHQQHQQQQGSAQQRQPWGETPPPYNGQSHSNNNRYPWQ
ncbi:potassium voltage-dependent transporter [Colletotrichum karsti]|uniref:Potassium voltage-dependent transporter n=1 Tax=Colletotrichum karsti TaxID=1095194 RepID=A0A9P6ID41_9PEZI|nr:potassium voltage-dependent transporter [Colletotrichum karsti]KAF9881378.1 potassium voltage-dependent transporter [Colletotrichum karsti]